MMHFQLFRLKVQFIPQGELFGDGIPKREVMLRQAVFEKPAAELRKGYEWHIGNVQSVAESGVYFAVGRITRSTLPLFDESTGEFKEVDFDEAPYTHALLDVELQLLALARKSRLSPTVGGIARQVARLLMRTNSISRLDGTVVSDPLRDPEEFIDYLRSAWAVTRFKSTFGRPNLFDVSEDFELPMERLLEHSDGKEGHAVVKGEKLDSEVLAELARSAASRGEDATAIMRMAPEGDIIRKGLREKSVEISEEEPVDKEKRRGLLKSIRATYMSIRGEHE